MRHNYALQSRNSLILCVSTGLVVVMWVEHVGIQCRRTVEKTPSFLALFLKWLQYATNQSTSETFW
jgi:hypothetical protein